MHATFNVTEISNVLQSSSFLVNKYQNAASSLSFFHASIYFPLEMRNLQATQKSRPLARRRRASRKHVIQIPSSYPFSDYVSALDEGLLRETLRSKSKLWEQREKLWERKLEWRRALKGGFCTMSLLIAIQLVGITPRILRSFYTFTLIYLPIYMFAKARFLNNVSL